ncbi:MAG: TetR/AcrR family transcriptional regulator [Dermatophilaceae bacterium]
MATPTRPTVRERVRAEMTDEITRVAREQLARQGANLSMRAVAREVGVVSSALYRYFPSRDELLTALVLHAYRELAVAATAAEATAPREDPAGRWAALCHGIRGWAQAHPHEYALLYGTPVPGYAAPPETVEPASVPLLLMVAIMREALAEGRSRPRPQPPMGQTLRASFLAIAASPGLQGGTAEDMARLSIAWTAVFGAISFELFGRLQGAGLDYDAWFAYQVQALATDLGLVDP